MTGRRSLRQSAPARMARVIQGRTLAVANPLARKPGHVVTGWRGYFTGRAVHITKTDRAAAIARWLRQRQQRLSANGRCSAPPVSPELSSFGIAGPANFTRSEAWGVERTERGRRVTGGDDEVD
jgi:hypothetical protein